LQEILGLDVSKDDVHAALLIGERTLSKSFPNSRRGVIQIAAWLKNRKVERVHACMESTGGYEEVIALGLHERGHIVSIMNPSQIKAFAKSELLRTKTDAVDAALIARFCRSHNPAPWNPPAPEIRALQALVRRFENLQDMVGTERNRLEHASSAAVGRSIEELIAHLERQIETVEREIADLFDQHPGLRAQRDLLVSIPGIAQATAARILGEMPEIAEYRSSKCVAAFAGLSPQLYHSGRLRARTRISKAGNSRLRKALYFPAMSSVRCNPLTRALYNRLLAAGKPKMVALIAVMRKLLVLAYGVLKSGQPFDPAYAGS
jgi:transposase